MRILLVSHFFPPRHTAGTEIYTLGIAKALRLHGHEVEVLCAEDWETGDEYWNGVTDDTYQSVSVRRIHLNWKKAPDPNEVLYDSKLVEKWIFQYLNKSDFDLVHITSAYSLGIGAMRGVIEARIPLVLTLTDFWFLCPSLQLIRSDGRLCNGITTARQCQSCLMADAGISRKLTRIGIPRKTQNGLWSSLARVPQLAKQRGLRGKLLDMTQRKRLLQDALELPNLILAPSRTVQDMFRSHTHRDIKLLRHGHELSWLRNYKGKIRGDKLRIGYIGQIIPIKGVHLLVEAFRIAHFNGEAQLVIWGGLEQDFGYVAQLRSLIADNPSISLCGRFEHDNLASVFSSIDVLVVPSIWYENAPLTIQEAFATKTPVIAADLGGMAEAVTHEVDGLLFETGSVDALAKQLRRFVEEPGLRELLAAGTRAPRAVEQEAVELEALYHSLVKYQSHRESRRTASL